jgi:isopenicillin-N epimerase
MMDWATVRALYMMPAGVIYLNNGSVGPSPRPVFEALVRYMQQLEENPSVYAAQYDRMLNEVKPKLAAFLGARPECTAIVMNLTWAMNVVSRGIRGLAAGDEILTTDQEYGAVNNAWEYAAGRQGLLIRRVGIPSPPESPRQIVAIIEKGITSRTRVIYVSHITSSTGLVMPVKEICALARARGVLSVIDGAHAPGMLSVDIEDIGCDFYAGNCHKWLCAPKGTAFIAAHPRSWDRLEPFLVGWGWTKDRPETFIGNIENPGNHNTAIPNAIGDAIDFQLSIGKQRIETRGKELAEYGMEIFTRLPGVKLLTPRDPAMRGSMAAYTLPPLEDGEKLKIALRARGLLVPAGADPTGGRMRISTHIYNSKEELDLLDEALSETWPS